MVNLFGQTEDVIEENGKMESNMVKDPIFQVRDMKGSENGGMAR